VKFGDAHIESTCRVINIASLPRTAQPKRKNLVLQSHIPPVRQQCCGQWRSDGQKFIVVICAFLRFALPNNNSQRYTHHDYPRWPEWFLSVMIISRVIRYNIDRYRMQNRQRLSGCSRNDGGKDFEPTRARFCMLFIGMLLQSVWRVFYSCR
jgi:hypothetical protein